MNASGYLNQCHFGDVRNKALQDERLRQPSLDLEAAA